MATKWVPFNYLIFSVEHFVKFFVEKRYSGGPTMSADTRPAFFGFHLDHSKGFLQSVTSSSEGGGASDAGVCIRTGSWNRTPQIMRVYILNNNKNATFGRS